MHDTPRDHFKNQLLTSFLEAFFKNILRSLIFLEIDAGYNAIYNREGVNWTG